MSPANVTAATTVMYSHQQCLILTRENHPRWLKSAQVILTSPTINAYWLISPAHRTAQQRTDYALAYPTDSETEAVKSDTLLLAENAGFSFLYATCGDEFQAILFDLANHTTQAAWTILRQLNVSVDLGTVAQTVGQLFSAEYASLDECIIATRSKVATLADAAATRALIPGVTAPSEPYFTAQELGTYAITEYMSRYAAFSGFISSTLQTHPLTLKFEEMAILAKTDDTRRRRLAENEEAHAMRAGREQQPQCAATPQHTPAQRPGRRVLADQCTEHPNHPHTNARCVRQHPEMAEVLRQERADRERPAQRIAGRGRGGGNGARQNDRLRFADRAENAIADRDSRLNEDEFAIYSVSPTAVSPPEIKSPSKTAYFLSSKMLKRSDTKQSLKRHTSFIMDTGASHGYTNNPDHISNPRTCSTTIKTANGSMASTLSGDIDIVVNGQIKTTLHDAMACPDLSENLCSVSTLADNGYDVTFGLHDWAAIHPDPSKNLSGPRVGNSYHLLTDTPVHVSGHACVASDDCALATAHEWHTKLGHLSLGKMKELAHSNAVPGFTSDLIAVDCLHCVDCAIGKMKEAKYPKNKSTPATRPGQIIVFDGTGPIRTTSTTGKRYLFNVLDVYTRKRWSIPCRDRSEYFAAFKNTAAIIENHCGRPIEIIRSDNEFRSLKFTQWCQTRGTTHQFTVRYSSAQNGIAERSMLTSFDCIRAILSDSGLPPKYWADAAIYSNFVMDRCLTFIPHGQKSPITPHEAWTGNPPDVSMFHRFGEECYGHLHSSIRRDKLSDRSTKCKFLGISPDQKAYRLLDSAGRVIGYRTVQFGPFSSTETLGRSDTLGHSLNPTVLSDVPAAGPMVSTPVVTAPVLHNRPLDLPPVVPPSEPATGGVHLPMTNPTSEVGVRRAPLSTPSPRVLRFGNFPTQVDPLIGSPLPIDDMATPRPLVQPDAAPVPSRIPVPSRTPVPSHAVVPTPTEDTPSPPISPTPTDAPGWTYQPVSEGPQDTSAISNDNIIPDLPEVENGGNRRSRRHAKCAKATRLPDPLSIGQARGRHDWLLWKTAINSELDALYDMKVLADCPVPAGHKAVGSKLVFKIKRDSSGNIERYKVRLVAKGFSQIEGDTFFDTYAPVAKMNSIRVFANIVASNGLHCHQADVNTAFLIPELNEEIYLKSPAGFPPCTWRLKKTLYGLKQSNHEWFMEADAKLKSLGFKPCLGDSCMYVRTDSDGRCFYIALYVDDMLFAHHNLTEVKRVMASVGAFWPMKDLGQVHQFLGITVTRNLEEHTIHLSQKELLLECLELASLTDCNATQSPYDLSAPLHTAKEWELLLSDSDKTLYQRLVGKLLYISNNTRPDLCCAVNMLASYVSKPTDLHMLALKKVLRYCKGTIDDGIVLGGPNPLQILVGYSDADWAGDLDTRRSRTGYIFTLGPSCVTWQSKKQTTVALSTMEAEYLALSSATQELRWLRVLLDELGFPQDIVEMQQDNTSCISLTKGNSAHSRSKHIDIRHHSLRDEIEQGHMSMTWCSTKKMIADIMTKPLPVPRFNELKDMLNMSSAKTFAARRMEAVRGESGSLASALVCMVQTCLTLRIDP